METLAELYRVNETNLALRREFMRLTARDIAVLRRLVGWSEKTAAPLAREFYDFQFAFAPTRNFFQGFAADSGHTIDQLRTGLEQAQAGYFREIFAEAAGGGGFGVSYFEGRLRVGRRHNAINLPFKWYLGSYPMYFDLVRKHLRRRYPHRPVFRARAERAIMVVMNADAQAIVEAFYFDTFQAMGVDLSRLEVERPELDLSDKSAELKALVEVPLRGISRALGTLRAATGLMTTSSEETNRAITEIANAVGDVAQGAERQARMVDETKDVAEAAAAAARQARTLSTDGIAAATKATGAMASVRTSAAQVSATMAGLASKSEQIGEIVETITGIASQTNLLALNAAIEAARAGEQGRGFAVVAEEVRKLAEDAQHAAGRISALIGEIQHETDRAVAVVQESVGVSEEGSAVVEQAREAFAAISGSVDDISSRIEQMAHSTAEVAAVAEQSSASAQQVSASTEQTSAATEEVANSARDLMGTAEELEDIVSAFTLAESA